MGMNPRYGNWNHEQWQGYCPTIGDMVSRGWSLTLHCQTCRLAIAADPQKIIAQKGRGYSPWGKSARCPRLYCVGRMRLRAYAPRPNQYIDI